MRRCMGLVKAKADVNIAAAPSGMFDSLCHAPIAEVVEVGTERRLHSQRCFSVLRGLTPLGHAVWIGDP